MIMEVAYKQRIFFPSQTEAQVYSFDGCGEQGEREEGKIAFEVTPM